MCRTRICVGKVKILAAGVPRGNVQPSFQETSFISQVCSQWQVDRCLTLTLAKWAEMLATLQQSTCVCLTEIHSGSLCVQLFQKPTFIEPSFLPCYDWLGLCTADLVSSCVTKGHLGRLFGDWMEEYIISGTGSLLLKTLAEVLFSSSSISNWEYCTWLWGGNNSFSQFKSLKKNSYQDRKKSATK